MDSEGIRAAICQAKTTGSECARKMAQKAAEEGAENPILNSARQAADSMLKAPIGSLPFSLFRRFDTDGNRRAYETAYFDHRKRLGAVALAELKFGQDYIAPLEDVIWAICDEYSWALPAHMSGKSLSRKDNSRVIDLFASETAFALAEITAVCAGQLSPAVVTRAKNEIFRRVIDSYRDSQEKQLWERIQNNWCAVCAGSLGCAAIYLIDDGNKLADFLLRLMPTLERYVNSFEADGACTEGLSYWTYGMSFYVGFADLLLQRTDGRIDLLAGEKIEQIATFQQKCYFADGTTVSFADGHPHDHFRPGLTNYLAERFPQMTIPPDCCRADFYTDDCYRWMSLLRDVVWSSAKPESAGVTGCDYLPDAQWLICRSGKTGFAAKGGHNAENHNHNDVGCFLYHKNGEILIADLGAGEYTKDYFSAKRYQIFCNSSFGHSVPIIDGMAQSAGGAYRAKSCGRVGESGLTMDIAKAYEAENLHSAMRVFEFNVKNGALLLRDCFSFQNEGSCVVERFITLVPPVIKKDAVLLSAQKASCEIRCTRKAQITVTEESHPVQKRGSEGNVQQVYCVDFTFPGCARELECEFAIS